MQHALLPAVFVGKMQDAKVVVQMDVLVITNAKTENVLLKKDFRTAICVRCKKDCLAESKPILLLCLLKNIVRINCWNVWNLMRKRGVFITEKV